MTIAHILISCDTGYEKAVIDKLRQIEGVRDVHGVFGAYDIIAKIECIDKDRIREIITWKIRKIPRIRTTITLLATEGMI